MPVKLKVAGEWQRATAKVKVAGEWQAAQTWVKSGGAWSRVGVQDWDLGSSIATPAGITFDGTKFYVTDTGSSKSVNIYDASGVYESQFSLPTAITRPRGITWDGSHLYIVDSIDHKAYAFSSSGVHQPSSDFDFHGDNRNASGITWDGSYFHVLDEIDNKVYVYDADGNHVG